MQKKQYLKLLFFILFITGSFLDASSLFKEHKTKIISINENTAIVKNFPDVKIGSSGIVVHRYSKNHSTIVAKIIVIAKNSDTMKILFKSFKDLKQPVLPLPKILPQAGDTVILNFLYNKALMIAPNYQTYKNIENRHTDITWLNPDLFAAKLFADNDPNPHRSTFKNMCKNYSFSLLYFAINKSGYFVDCNSFKILSKEHIKNSGKIMLPFYSRIKNIQASWLSFGKSKIKNYNEFYTNLLR